MNSTECYPFHVQKVQPQAEHPYKEHDQDVGYNVTLIGRKENRAEDSTDEVNEFNTGLILAPTEGYYLEMYAHKDLHKHGYNLITGVSIIDPTFRGELIVPLYKFSDVPDIELPFNAVQLIVRRQVPTRAHTSTTLVETSQPATNHMASALYGESSKPMATHRAPTGRSGNHMF